MIPNLIAENGLATWARSLIQVLQPWMSDIEDTKFTQGQTARVASFVVASLPTGRAGGIIFVSNETGGAVLAFSDGTDWRRVTDRAVVA